MGQASKNTKYATPFAMLLIGVVIFLILVSLSPIILTQYWAKTTREVPTSLIFDFTKVDCRMYETYSNLTGTNILSLEAPRYWKYFMFSSSEEIKDFGIMRWKNSEMVVLSSSTLDEGHYVFEKGHYIQIKKYGTEELHSILVIDDVCQATPFHDGIAQYNKLAYTVLAIAEVAVLALIVVSVIEIASKVWKSGLEIEFHVRPK